MNQLSLKYRYDASFSNPKLARDDFGWLSVSANTDRFSGTGGFWVQWQDVREFGDALAVFPVEQDAPITADWGYNMREGEDLIVRIEIAAADKRGELLAKFVIADLNETHERVAGSFPTSYADLEAFRHGIAKMMDQQIEEAVLVGR